MRRATSRPFPAGLWARLCVEGMGGAPFLNLVSCARSTGGLGALAFLVPTAMLSPGGSARGHTHPKVSWPLSSQPSSADLGVCPSFSDFDS